MEKKKLNKLNSIDWHKENLENMQINLKKENLKLLEQITKSKNIEKEIEILKYQISCAIKENKTFFDNKLFCYTKKGVFFKK